MKKFTFFMAVAALACGMMVVSCNKDDEENGGGNTNNLPTTIDENFDNGIPSSWTVIDADGDGHVWMASTAQFQQPCGVNNTDCAASASYTNTDGALETDNYLVSPKIYVNEGATLTYQVTNFQAEYPDQYSCMLGTVENGSFKAIATLVTERVNTGFYDGNGAYTSKSFDLSQYKGKEVCIAFRHNDTDAYWLLIDNVKVQ